MRVKPLPLDAKASYELASQQVAKLDTARTLFAERKYPDVITSLQPLLQAGQGPAVDPPGKRQPPPQVPQIVSDHAQP